MIAHLSGVIRHKAEGYLIVDANGVGYRVVVSTAVCNESEANTSIELFTHLEMRENLMELYGFITIEEVEIFKKLLTVTSIGPKTAMNILEKVSITQLKEAIAHGDSSTLEQIKGIGKKTAERLVLELKSIFQKGKTKKPAENSEEIDALVALGYSTSEARTALAKVPKSVKGDDARIKAALKSLAKT
ncbi:Holliday junction branch migration protein RuvA [Patescibacteria group bacterium]